MDQGWDHTENEDKILLDHTLGMDRDMGKNTDMIIRDKVSSVSSSGCNNDKIAGGGGSTTLNTEYNQQILSILINNYNLLFGLSPNPFEFPVLIYYINQLNLLYSFICEICKICNSKCKCSCSCKCEPPCTGNTICLCLCDCSKGEAKECCICICKHKDGCKCVCICICNRPGESCGGQTHTCKECLVKVDIQSLMCNTSKILYHLKRIRCYISRLENQSGSSNTCCCCSCCLVSSGPSNCFSYCCCKYGTMSYLSKISRMDRIEYLFKQIGTKILELTKMNYSLSFYSGISNSCKKCNCCDNIKNLIDYIEKAGQYYSSFASIIGDIRMLVDYKTFCPQANEIIEKLKISVSPLLNKLSEINSQVLINVDLTRISDELLLVVYSNYSIFQCFLAMYILLLSSSKMGSIMYNIRWVDQCFCIRIFKSKNTNNGLKISDYEKYIIPCCDKTIEDLRKLVMNNERNHLCLCLVIMYILYPNLINSMYCLRQIYNQALSKQTKEFTLTLFKGIQVIYITKLIYLIIIILYKIIFWIKNKYYYAMTSHIHGVEIKCYCTYHQDPNYNYLISIILYVSSLIANIWSMDHLSIVSAIDCVSSLLAEYQSIHVYTNYGSGESMFKTSQNFMIFSHFGSSTRLCLKDLYMELDIKKSNILINNSVKSYYKSVNSILTIGIPLPLFNIVLYKLSSVSFVLMNQNNAKSVAYIKHSNNITTLIYTKSLCQQKNQICCKIGVCKICPIAKIKISCLSISMKRIEVVLSNVIRNILLFHLKVDIGRSRDFITNLCVGFGEVYTIMLKNTLINNDHVLRSYGNTGITNVETRNWGYDTKYEHDVSTDKGFRRGDGYPNLLSYLRYTFSHLPIFP